MIITARSTLGRRVELIDPDGREVMHVKQVNTRTCMAIVITTRGDVEKDVAGHSLSFRGTGQRLKLVSATDRLAMRVREEFRKALVGQPLQSFKTPIVGIDFGFDPLEWVPLGYDVTFDAAAVHKYGIEQRLREVACWPAGEQLERLYQAPDGRWVAIGTRGTVMDSPDGFNWTKRYVDDSFMGYGETLLPKVEKPKGCPKCGHAGEFVRMALCCPTHGAFGGC